MTILRYRITSWDEIGSCLSNNDRRFHVHCITITDEDLRCKIIRLDHEKYGTVFAGMVEGTGSMLTKMDGINYHMFGYRDSCNLWQSGKTKAHCKVLRCNEVCCYGRNDAGRSGPDMVSCKSNPFRCACKGGIGGNCC